MEICLLNVEGVLASYSDDFFYLSGHHFVYSCIFIQIGEVDSVLHVFEEIRRELLEEGKLQSMPRSWCLM